MASPLVARQAAVFAALGDATRLHLVAQLDRAPSLSISTLAEGVRLTRQAVAKHLKVLEDAGIVVPAKIGREQRYAVRPAALAEADAYLQVVAAKWDGALARLQAHVEDDGGSTER